MMYKETGILCPYFQDFSPEVQQLVLDELFPSHQSPSSMIGSSFNSEYDFGGQSDLIKAPEPVFHELIASLGSMEASIPMVPFADQSYMPIHDHDFVNLENELFDNVLCNDVFANSSTEANQINEIIDSRLPAIASEFCTDEDLINESSAFPKSVSTGSLSSSMVPLSPGNNTMRSGFLDSEAVYGIRRAFSEGDIRTRGYENLSFIVTSLQWPRVTGFGCSSEERQKKLSRYRIKKLKRNFGRKIKYACRKALADSQPRIRGRFAKTRDTLSCQRENDANQSIDTKDW